jgi:chromosome segregation protein
MRLKHLELFGYKTFASRTEFLFDDGITAIVGPNGSGKSNVADAIRWVLGEQTFSLLRARKSEDMIFSGSERRARMSMAEVTITLDNTENWLPIEFSEVTLARRSYRSGENEYLLNGSRVRLRDITDLLGKTGLSKRTYTVIGQGLVDTALSLRPHERRALIEEAAGLTLYRSRRADAMNKLDETQRNVLRVHDLIAEISPHLRQLERQAERTREYARIHKELKRALRIWYGYQWKCGRSELQRVRTIAQRQLERLTAQQALAHELGTHIAQLRTTQSDLRRQLSVWHHESSALHTQSEKLQRDLAVAEERRRMLIQQREEVVSEVTSLEGSRSAQEEQFAAAESELAALSETLAQQLADVDEAQAALDAHRQEAEALSAAQAAAQKELFLLRTQIADCESRSAQLQERQRELQEERDAHDAACRSIEERMSPLRERSASLEASLKDIEVSTGELKDERTRLEQRMVQVQQRQQELYEQRNELDQHLGRLRERHHLLTRMRDEGEGLYDGVRGVLQAAEGKGQVRLEGIVGMVAEFIRVPRELETAVEVALGGKLQSVVVESWASAQAAIAHLKHTRSGRATFLPLDTLRVGKPIRVPQLKGMIGLASELVECETRLRPVVAYLLGQTLVCQDLPTARHVLDALQGSYQIVTPDGEIVRSSGEVTGGASKQRRQGGILAREREWRELPGRIDSLQKRRQSLVNALQDATARETSLREDLSELSARQSELDAEQSARSQERDTVRRQVDQGERERDWHRSLIAETERELEELEQRRVGLQQRFGGLKEQVSAVETKLASLQARIAQADDRDLQAQLAERRAQIALTRQRQAGKQAEWRGYKQNLQQIEEQIAARNARGDELAAHLTQTEHQLAGLRHQESALRDQIQSYAARIEPAEQALEELERQQNQAEKDERQAQSHQQALESRYSHTQLQVSRQEDRMDNLKRQIKGDLGLVDLDMGEDLSGQPPLPLEPLVSSLPDVDVLPDGLEEQMKALQRHLHRLGAVNPDAPAEYDQTRQRYEFLTTQAQDLEQAMTHLRKVIAELEEVMEREFKRTFYAIAREFKIYFTKLFDGGSARLELSDPDDLTNTGIDIVARPPGKRQQGLALLSGGERALTAAALIFAMLSVSPTPFCVLDEVDAALDEANVGRFRAILKSLSGGTQFVVITHNRYTIEMADIVYGISMGADGASCMVSHRMNGRKSGGDRQAAGNRHA